MKHQIQSTLQVNAQTNTLEQLHQLQTSGPRADTEYQITANYSDSSGGPAAASITFRTAAVPQSAFLAENAVLAVSQTAPDQWHTASLNRSYQDPVIIMGPVTSNDSEAVSVRVRNVSSTSFEYQIDEWSSFDGVHRSERIG